MENLLKSWVVVTINQSQPPTISKLIFPLVLISSKTDYLSSIVSIHLTHSFQIHPFIWNEWVKELLVNSTFALSFMIITVSYQTRTADIPLPFSIWKSFSKIPYD